MFGWIQNDSVVVYGVGGLCSFPAGPTWRE